MTFLFLGFTLTATALVSLALTPLDFPVAKRLGAIDTPREKRRMHKYPIPRLGGISIFFSFLLISLILCFDRAQSFFYLWAGAILLVCVGVLDDSTPLPPQLKLLAQFGAAYVSTMGGNVLYTIPLEKAELATGRLAIPLTIFWLVLLINAHNFIDGLDGLCGGIVVSESAFLGLIALKTGEAEFSILALAACGACIGFLPYNLNGAKLFMGDTGSTFLGYIVAWVSVGLLSRPRANSPSLLVLVLVLAVPLADIAVAIMRRLAKGKSPFLPDRSHIHHMLADTSLGHFGASRLLRLAAAFLGAMGYLILAMSR